MSVNVNKLKLEIRDLKYLFMASYFRWTEYERFSAESEPFIAQYLRNDLHKLDEESLLRFIDYLHVIQLKHLVADRSLTMFTHIKPQFRYLCKKNNMDLMNFDDKVFVQTNTPVYATNMFVRNPRDFRVELYREFSRVFSKREFVVNDDRYCLLNGAAGYLFDDVYLDWSGVRICKAPRSDASDYPFRLYLVGEQMAHYFSANHIVFGGKGQTYTLKNFHKGLRLFRNNYRLINNKKFQTTKPSRVFDEIRTELNAGSSHVKFIQRDYMYDANKFPQDLLDALNEYMTDTSMYKYVTKFTGESEIDENEANAYSEIVVDRYAVDQYRKLSIKKDANTRFPSLHADSPAHLFVRPDIVQLKGTLNAFYVPRDGLVAILASNSLFGSNELLHFDMKLVKYTNSAPPRRLLDDTYIVNKQQKLYLTRYVFGNTVPAYLLIRGDYESSFKSLYELKNSWVLNTLLHLILTPALIERSLQIQNGGVAPA
uniref:49 kDa protein n=1 Tax=Lymantria dispar multicapsid nuclear polyhedrosis virus TaxID=10449 RepID=A0A1B1MQT3_NPVLD|nr:49 kDa protein [Lymantria dispar multiple nucleopolyhedrovirus]